MIVAIHPTGNQNVRRVLGALHERHRLALFATTLGHSAEAAFPWWLPSGLRGEWERRSYDLPPRLIRPSPRRELCRIAAGRAGLRSLTRYETGWFCVDSIYRHLDAEVARGLGTLAREGGVRAVYGYEDGCCESFRRAKDLGLTCLYDLPIAYWETARRLLQEEVERMPAWTPTLAGAHDSDEKTRRKTEELALADTILCPSRFVADSLPEGVRAAKKVVIAPFGSPSAGGGGGTQKKINRASPARLRVLFAGGMTQRKGLGDLFAAMNLLGRSDIELVVMGSLLAPMEFYRRECADFVHEPPRPHAEVLQLMRSADVFVLPSIVEGRALVMQEAMSQGLPILITANTGGEDLVETGRTGFLVPIRSAEAIASRLAWFADHPGETREMGEMARAKAEAYTWAGYGATVAGAVEEQLALS